MDCLAGQFPPTHSHLYIHSTWLCCLSKLPKTTIMATTITTDVRTSKLREKVNELRSRLYPKRAREQCNWLAVVRVSVCMWVSMRMCVWEACNTDYDLKPPTVTMQAACAGSDASVNSDFAFWRNNFCICWRHMQQNTIAEFAHVCCCLLFAVSWLLV